MKKAHLAIFFMALSLSLTLTTYISIKRVYAQSGIVPIELTGSFAYHTLRLPTGLVVQTLPSGSGIVMFIADTGNHKIRSFVPNGGGLMTVAGNGIAGYVDGAPLSSEFNHPTGLAGRYNSVSRAGTVYSWTVLQVSDTDNFSLRQICTGRSPIGDPCSVQGVSTITLAGMNVQGSADGPAASATFGHVAGLLSSGSYYIADTDNNKIRLLSSGTVSTFAGTGDPGLVNGAAASAKFNFPTKAIVGAAGNVIIVDAGNHAIRKVNTSGVVSTLAGNGQPGYANGSPSAARFYRPTSIAYNAADGYYYIVDKYNHCIRRMDTNGNVTTYAGTNVAGYQDGTLSAARFNEPSDLAIVNGYMYVSDTNNNSIRQIDMTHQTVSTFLN